MLNQKYKYLNDNDFLQQVDKMSIKNQYVKITVLTFQEKAIDSIEGLVTGGSLNLDGNSKIRRTCSLSMVLSNMNNDFLKINSLLSINKKIIVEIGFTNTTDQYQDYEIIWFPLGHFVISSVALSNSTAGLTVNLQLKDKMSLLNGECGGVLPATVQLDSYDELAQDGTYIIKKPTIYQIIQESVNHFGGEPLHNIIISDIDNKIKQVMKWTGTTPLYIVNTGTANNASYYATTDFNYIKYIAAEQVDKYAITIDAHKYKVFEYGDNVGYIYVDFVFPNDLIMEGGATVCDILDKIVQTLGNYEYFYDINGNFIFQEKKNFLNTSQSTTELQRDRLSLLTGDDYLIDFTKGSSVYNFDQSLLVTAYTNNPQYNMIKNDFIVWGVRNTVEGLSVPIRYHLAIDDKPVLKEDASEYEVYYYTDPDTKITTLRCLVQGDAADGSGKDVRPRPGSVDYYYKYQNKAWRWDPEIEDYVELNSSQGKIIAPGSELDYPGKWRLLLFLQEEQAAVNGLETGPYYAELKSEFAKIFDVQNECYFDNLEGHSLDYWLDFIDSSAAISELSIKNIGKRSKVVVDEKINCLFEPAIPELIYLKQPDISDENSVLEYNTNKELAQNNNIPWSQLDDTMYSALAYGGGFNSAYDLVRSLLYQYTSYNESITLQTVPIFHLEPNTRISVNDAHTGIKGDYVITNMSIPFDINSTMTISCVKALNRL